MEFIDKKGYILLSGGQDSFASLIWAKENFEEVEAVSILYAQKHKQEIEYAKRVAEHFGIRQSIYDIGDFLQSIANSTLLQDGDHNQKHEVASHLPASFVPNRNGLFFTIASNHAYRNGEKHIHLITGTCQTDYSGYPDCRDSYIKSKAVELSLGLDCPVSIHTPLMWLNKAQTFEIADKAGKINEINTLTLTCYNGVEDQNPWGRGCGNCPSCKLRKAGYEEFTHSK